MLMQHKTRCSSNHIYFILPVQNPSQTIRMPSWGMIPAGGTILNVHIREYRLKMKPCQHSSNVVSYLDIEIPGDWWAWCMFLMLRKISDPCRHRAGMPRGWWEFEFISTSSAWHWEIWCKEDWFNLGLDHSRAYSTCCIYRMYSECTEIYR